MSPGNTIVLASASTARAAMLEHAGVPFVREPADIDERRVKSENRSNGSNASQTALALAEEKARHVANGRRGGLVIGSDQILECDDVWFDKPTGRAEAMETLRKLRGRSHMLVSAVSVVRDNRCLWRCVDVARLTMRPFTDDFLRRYLNEAGASILESVGAYRVEGTGIQLFSRIDGDHFTVLGMPLLPLLDFLRREKALET